MVRSFCRHLVITISLSFARQTQFVVDEVSNIIKESIESTIGGNSYTHAKVNNWTNSVVESCLASLTKLQKPFKYIGMYVCVTTVVAGQTGLSRVTSF